MQSEKFHISYAVVLRNAGLNLGGRVFPLVIAIVAIPIIIRGLGMERYGILSLTLVVLMYFSLFDFGLGQATTKFVAEALGRGDHARLGSLMWTSFVLISGLGLVAGILMALVSPALVSHLLKISPGFHAEAVKSFYIVSAAAPFMLASSAWQGALEAKQRYDLVNAVTVPSSAATYLIPAAAVYFHRGLIPIVTLLLISKALALLAFVGLCLREYPELREGFIVSFVGSRPLLVFGGWLAISNLSWPVLLYMDRLVIGSVMNVSMVPYYSAPCDIVTRLWVLPASWVALYPAFSATSLDRHEELSELCVRAVKHLALLLGPAVIVLMCFAGDLLRVWLGPQFEAASTVVFRILALGVLVNSLGNVPDKLIKGIGRPDIVGKLHVAEIPIYAALVWFFVSRWGLIGAAVGWTLRASIEAVIFFAISWKLIPSNRSAFREAGIFWLAVSLVAFGGLMWIALASLQGLWQYVVASFLLAAACILAWRCLLDNADRTLVRSLLHLTT